MQISFVWDVHFTLVKSKAVLLLLSFLQQIMQSSLRILDTALLRSIYMQVEKINPNKHSLQGKGILLLLMGRQRKSFLHSSCSYSFICRVKKQNKSMKYRLLAHYFYSPGLVKPLTEKKMLLLMFQPSVLRDYMLRKRGKGSTLTNSWFC